jgi:hypothetical protein
MDKITLDDLLAMITNAVCDARFVMEERTIEGYKQYFDSNGRPKTLKLLIGESEIEVSECALVHHNSAKLKTFDFQFEGRVETVEKKLYFDLSSNNRAEGVDNKSNISLKISFDTDSAPETMLRINDRFIENI